MATIQQFHNGTGSQSAFTFTFKSLLVDDIKVAVKVGTNDYWTDQTLTTHYTISPYDKETGGTITFTSGNEPALGTNNVRIYRDTNVDAVTATYQAGSSIRADDLNSNKKQDLYALQELKDGGINTPQIIDGAITSAKIRNDSIINEDINASAAIAHSKLATIDSGKVLLGNVSNIPTATALTGDVHIDNAGATTIQDNAVQIANISDTETSLTSTSDVKLPTSKAVADHVADVVNSVGGFRVVANKDSFPDAHPDPKENAGTVLSITNPVDLTVTTGTSTNGTRSGGGSVTITDIPTDAGSTLSANYSMLVQTTTTAHEYTFYKFLAKDGDVLSLSNDMNDFAARYRVTEGEPSDSLDEGDLCFDKDAGKMKVYDGTSWGEVTATGDYKFLTLANTGTSTAATFNGTSDDTFDLKLGVSATGSAATVTTALQCIVSLNGVIQKPNTGTFDGTQEGFYIPTSSTIKFCDPPPANSQVFVVQIGTGTQLLVPNDNSVTAAKTDLSIAQGDVIVGTGVDAWANLPAGTSGQYLKTQGTGADVVWADVPAGVGGDNGVQFNDNVEVTFGTGSDNDLVIKHAPHQNMLEANDGAIAISADEIQLLSNDTAGRAVYLDGPNDRLELGYDGVHSVLINTTGVQFVKDVQINAQEELRFADADSSNYVGFKSPATVAANKVWTLPDADGTTGQALTTNGTATLAWSNVESTVANGAIYINDDEITADYTVAAGKGAHSVGPITLTGCTVTVNGRWVVS